MTRLPVVNARVRKVERPATSGHGGGYGPPPEPAVTLWEGDLPASYLARTATPDSTAGGWSVHSYGTLCVPSEVVVDEGAHVTVSQRGAQWVGQVDATEPRPDYGYTRIFLQHLEATL